MPGWGRAGICEGEWPGDRAELLRVASGVRSVEAGRLSSLRTSLFPLAFRSCTDGCLPSPLALTLTLGECIGLASRRCMLERLVDCDIDWLESRAVCGDWDITLRCWSPLPDSDCAPVGFCGLLPDCSSNLLRWYCCCCCWWCWKAAMRCCWSMLAIMGGV